MEIGKGFSLLFWVAAEVGFPQLILALLQPCYETVKAWLQENLLAVGIFGLCTALVQVSRAGQGLGILTRKHNGRGFTLRSL